LEIQLKLAQHQLAQYEEDKKAKDMFKTPSNMNLARLNVTPNVMTRSMARTAAAAQNLNMPGLAMQNRGFANPAFNATNFGGSAERIQMQPMRTMAPLQSSSSTIESIFGSNRNLNASRLGLTGANDPVISPNAALRLRVSNLNLGSDRFLNIPKPTAMSRFIGKIKNIGPRLKRLGQNVRPIRNIEADMQNLLAGEEPPANDGRLGPNMRVRYQGGQVHFEEVPGGILGPTPLVTRFRNAYNAVRDRLRREPAYRPGFRPTFTTRARNFVTEHKRKLAIAGGVLGGVGAIVGGLAGGLSGQEKEETMREGNVGALANIIKGGGGGFGGGGGGGGGGGSMWSTRRVARKRRSTKRRKTASPKRRKTKRRKTVKRLGGRRKVGKKAGGAKRINKKRRKSKKRFAAF